MEAHTNLNPDDGPDARIRYETATFGGIRVWIATDLADELRSGRFGSVDVSPTTETSVD